jgi:amidase
MTGILSLDATDQLRMLAEGRVGAQELLRETIRHAKAINPRLNTVVSCDIDQAFEAAKSIDGTRSLRNTLGALAGLPMTVKDTLDVKELPASAGMAHLLDRQAEDATVVARARSAGALIWGKTNTPVKAGDWQTYNPLYGTTNNPWNPQLTPGGSSGGSAAALAAGITALEIGADIGGSLRIPASFCGVFAHKPTYGLVPMKGLQPAQPGLDEIDLAVIGPMARSARDLRLLLSVLTNGEIPALPVDLKKLKIAIWLEEQTFPLDRSVRAVIDNFVGKISSSGAAIEESAAPVNSSVLMDTYITLLTAVMRADTSAAQRAFYEIFRLPAKMMHAANPDPLSLANILLGYTARRTDRIRANEARDQLCDTMENFFSRFDVLLSPITPLAAFPHDHTPMTRRKLKLSDGSTIPYLKMWNWVALATVCGLPATAIPCGLNDNGLPVGIQIIGPQGGDALTIAVAQAIEEGISGFTHPPISALSIA